MICGVADLFLPVVPRLLVVIYVELFGLKRLKIGDAPLGDFKLCLGLIVAFRLLLRDVFPVFAAACIGQSLRNLSFAPRGAALGIPL